MATKMVPILRSFPSVFIHADTVDKALKVLGLVAAVGDGMAMPVTLLIAGRIFNDAGSGPEEPEMFRSKMNKVQIK
ncbi:unnamed protein product [Urochloa humidicola]